MPEPNVKIIKDKFKYVLGKYEGCTIIKLL